MAKSKQNLDNLFARTTGGAAARASDNSDLNQGNIKPLGVGLSEGERSALDGIAGEHGISRNSLLRFAIRWFIVQYRAGDIDLTSMIETPPPPKKRLGLPE